MTDLDRRTLFRRAGLVGAALVVAPGVARPDAQADQRLSPFLHGVASGDPTADAVVIWTRVTAGTGAVPVRWLVAEDVTMTKIVARGRVTATAERDHCVKVDVKGLKPARHYYYAFEAKGTRSLIGRTKTAPTKGVKHLRFGVVSCSSLQHGFFNGYAALSLRDDLDAVLHLGDYLYEYAPGEYGDKRIHQPPVEMTTLAHYRGRHAQYRLDPDLRRLHQLFPFVTTWDDHESTDNSWRDGANNHQPGEGQWKTRKASAQRAYDEWLPIRSQAPDRIYRTLRYGDLADLIVLDTRLEGRDEQADTAVPAGFTLTSAEIDDPARRLISTKQLAWLKGELSSSKRRGTRWRVLCQQVCMGQWNLPGLPDAVLGQQKPDAPVLLMREDGNALNPDSWDGYTAERDRVYDYVKRAKIDNLVVLTGDVHSSWAMELSPNPRDLPEYESVGVEFVVPSITSTSLGETFAGAYPVVEAGIRNPVFNPHVKYLDSFAHGYVVLDVTPDAVQADWFHVDTILEPSVAESRGASWRVRKGAPRLLEAPAAAPSGARAPAAPAPDTSRR